MSDFDLQPGHWALLQQGYRNNWQRYLDSLSGSDISSRTWDICVITASNSRQAEAYEAQLSARRAAGQLSQRTHFRVLPDPDGRRIGSGGATLRVLSILAEELRDENTNLNPFRGKRVLIIHSGGDSKRLPHCSATGKLFARVPHQLPDGRPSSLFDEFLVSLSGLPSQIPEGVLVTSGDVLLLFDHTQLSFARPGIVGVAAATPAETGTHHGVYLTQASSKQVRSFLHKPSLETLVSAQAIDAQGNVQIDTGMVWLDRAVATQMLGLARQLEDTIDRGVTINLYGDLLAPLAQATDYDQYIYDASDGPATSALQEVRRLVWDMFRGTPFGAESLSPATFIHFGTTNEYLDVLRQGIRAFRESGWSGSAASWISANGNSGEQIVVNACVEGAIPASICLLDSHIRGDVLCDGAALLSHVVTSEEPLRLGSDLVLDQVVLRDGDGYISRLYGMSDNPKASCEDGGTMANLPWQTWLEQSPCSSEDLWPTDLPQAERTLWNALLYPVCASRAQSLEDTLWLAHPTTVSATDFERWRAAERLSLHSSYVRADVERLVAEQDQIEDQIRVRQFCRAVEHEISATEAVPFLGVGTAAGRRARIASDWIEASTSPWLPMRGYRALAVATDDQHWDDRAFSSLARLVRAHTGQRRFALKEVEMGKVRPAHVALPARIDFGGGWSDTPPYSIERGGAVLNAAISLWGRLPITAQAEPMQEPILELVSQDLDATIRPKTVGDVLDFANPSDPFALLKAALVFQGVIADDLPRDTLVSSVMQRQGYGVRLSTATSIPRGSGLGTSSILAGAILKALGQMMGRPADQNQLFDQVLCLEQMITTGGGWQDQIGGLVPGIKLASTEPGLPQLARVEPLQITASMAQALDGQLALIYTGQRRLAKNLLRQIMGRWMARDPEMIAMLHDIAQLALEMRQALEQVDMATFGYLISEHWEINKRMDDGCSNRFIDDLVAMCKPYILGTKLAGAGGGGFAIVITRDAQAKQDLRRVISERYPNSAVGMWPVAII